MTKQTREKEEPRRVGPKFARSVLPDSFQIRRPASPMADLLDEADRLGPSRENSDEANAMSTLAELTPVKSTPVKSVEGVGKTVVDKLPGLDVFLDRVLPRFPPPRQSILLRLYRWCEGEAREMVVSTPR